MQRHRLILGVLVSCGAVVAITGVGCSSSSSTAAEGQDAAVAETGAADTSVADTSVADTSVTDASAVDAAEAAVDASAACGTGPFQVFDPLMAQIAAGTPMTSVSVATNICTATATIPFGGMTSLSVPSNTPFFFIGTQAGNLPMLSSEKNIKFAGIPKIGQQVTMLATSYAVAVDPAWDPATHALLNVITNAATGTGICSAKDGISYTVVNHPGVVIRYEHGGTTSTGTGNSGDSLGTWFSIPTTGTMASPEYVTITQTKAGCTVGPTNADKLFITGRAPIARGVVTIGLNGEVAN
jgi:hypothetical protein